MKVERREAELFSWILAGASPDARVKMLTSNIKTPATGGKSCRDNSPFRKLRHALRAPGERVPLKFVSGTLRLS